MPLDPLFAARREKRDALVDFRRAL